MCIAGQTFRDDYNVMTMVYATMNSTENPLNLTLLTATCAMTVRNGLMDAFDMEDPSDLKVSFGVLDRPNLAYHIVPNTTKAVKDICVNLANIISHGKWQGQTGIIYTNTIAACDSVGNYLLKRGVESLRKYHGKLTSNERKAILNEFLAGRSRMIVATSAFGMGIDKANVLFVVHTHPPY